MKRMGFAAGCAVLAAGPSAYQRPDGGVGYVRTRPGYLAPAAGPSEAETARRKFDQEASAADTLSDFPVHLAGRMDKIDKGEPMLSLIIHVDLARLQFAERASRYLQRLQVIAALVNDRGEMVEAKEGLMDLALAEETLTRLTASGINATLGLSAPPDPYRVRVVVQELNGRMAAHFGDAHRRNTDMITIGESGLDEG